MIAYFIIEINEEGISTFRLMKVKSKKDLKRVYTWLWAVLYNSVLSDDIEKWGLKSRETKTYKHCGLDEGYVKVSIHVLQNIYATSLLNMQIKNEESLIQIYLRHVEEYNNEIYSSGRKCYDGLTQTILRAKQAHRDIHTQQLIIDKLEDIRTKLHTNHD